MCAKQDDQLLMLKKFPLLLPQNASCTSYSGFLVIRKRHFYVSVAVPNYPSLVDISLHCSWDLAYFLQGNDWKLQEFAVTSSMLSIYLTRLQNLVDVCMERRCLPPIHSDYANMESFQRLISDLENVGMEHVAHLSSDMRWLKLRVVDNTQRCHLLRLDVGGNYPHQNIQIQADLPQVTIQNIKQNTSLVSMFRSFMQQVSSLQNKWTLLEEVDKECWVLDPEHPERKDMSRRIVLGQNLSLQLTFDPSNEGTKPALSFFGPDQAIEPFRESLAANIEEWQEDGSLLDNLKCVLGLETFPVCPDESQCKKKVVYEGECVICFSMQLQGELPTEVCENMDCASPFHVACLLEWLQCVPDNIQSFNRINGTCPSCQYPISCPILGQH